MTPERAKEIWDRRGIDHGLPDMTAEERQEVIAVWNQMPGTTCFMEALWRIIKGNQPIECPRCHSTHGPGLIRDAAGRPALCPELH